MVSCKNLLLYEASAGSGKTFTLVNYYLKKILSDTHSYKNTIAVTFTNKAVNELKTRILNELYLLSIDPQESKHLHLLLDDQINKNDIISLSRKAKIALFNILHNYDLFSITTIDSFFKGIVSAFYNEINLFDDYTLELNTKNALEYTTNKILEDNNDTRITSYLTEFAINKLHLGNSWNIVENLKNLIKEIFSGFYMHLPSADMAHKSNITYKNIKTKLEESKQLIKSLSDEFFKICFDYNLIKEDFPRGTLYNYMCQLKIDVSSKTITKILDSKTYQDAINGTDRKIFKTKINKNELAAKKISKLLIEISATSKVFLGYFALQENIYIYSVLQRCEELINQYREEKKILFISDLTFLLNKLTKDYTVDFIYEKVGTKYNNYLIDEFQDTSIYQWKNFKPLIQEALASLNSSALIVGDEKQSIYRWREASSQDNIVDIYKNFTHHIDAKTLGVNYRSSQNVVFFNNQIFTLLPKAIDDIFNIDIISKVFKNTFQEPASKSSGYVNLEFITDTSDIKELAIEKTIKEINHLQDIGYLAKDISILVRNQKQAEMLSEALIEASNNNTKYNYNFVSDGGLCLANFMAAQNIISILKLISDPDNIVYYSEVLIALEGNSMSLEKIITIDYSKLPKELTDIVNNGFSLSLYNLCNKIICLLDLYANKKKLPVIDSFQNIVLNFELNTSNNLYDFLKYWEDEGQTKKIQNNVDSDAINILTIHKSKGLEFKAVIIPFCSWPLDENIVQTLPKILWGKEDDSQTTLPIPYKNYLKHSIFKDIFDKEKMLTILDSINMLYVAFTRSINYMKICCPKPKNEKKITKVSDLLFYVINDKNNNDIYHYYNSTLQQLEIGNK